MRGKTTLTIVSLALVLALPALADWDPSQPYKWVQYPDLSTFGIDVNATEPYILADDFLCDRTGPLTDIHIWASWLHDIVPGDAAAQAVAFTLSIHADIPASQSPTGYSMPGPVLWFRTFQPGEFVARVWASNIVEGFMTPPDMYLFPADWTCWQYNFFIDAAEAFVQEGTPDKPVVYWLDVQARPLTLDATFGWKTSVDHWNDAAVWGQGVEPYPGPWNMLKYPPGHELFGQPIDLAFVITGEGQHEELDFGDAPDPTYPTRLASNGARHMVVPGIFLGAAIDAEPDGQPHPNALGDDLNGPDEDGVVFMTPLVPGNPATINVTASVAGILNAWLDFAGDGSWAEPGDQFLVAQPIPAGTTAISFLVPPTTPVGLVTFARFRFAVNGIGSFVGLAVDGEVEDYQVIIEGEPDPYRFEFSLDIASDIELSDPFMNGNEAADPGDVYWWQGAPIVPPGVDGFKDDLFIFQNDPWPDPPDPALATRVPVGAGSPESYYEFFDLDGHDQTDFELYDVAFPILPFPSQCVYPPKHLFVSFDDDRGPGWPANDVPVTRPSPAGMVHGTTAGRDEVVGVNVFVQPTPPPYPLMNVYPFADEMTVHASLAPNPDNAQTEDDDVDSLDIVVSYDQCPIWYFTADHEAHLGLDPGDVYMVTAAGPMMVIDDVFHLGIPDETDVDAFEFAWVELPDGTGNVALALLFSVDDDDPLTPQNESGGGNPRMIYVSWMMGFSLPFTDPLQDDIDAITVWRDTLEPTGACCTAGVCSITTQFLCVNGGGYYKGDGTVCTATTCVCKGDANCDGLINFADINPFVNAIVSGVYCDGTGANCDMDNDGLVGFSDINPFVTLLTSNPLPIICP